MIAECRHCGAAIKRWMGGSTLERWRHVETGRVTCRPVTNAEPLTASVATVPILVTEGR